METSLFGCTANKKVRFYGLICDLVEMTRVELVSEQEIHPGPTVYLAVDFEAVRVQTPTKASIFPDVA